MSTFSEGSPVNGRPLHTQRALQKMQMKRRQWARELSACLQESSTPYLTITIHASRNNIRLSKPQRSVWPVCQSVFTHESTYPIGRGKKRTGCVFSRFSHVQGPVENHAQIPKRIFVMKGGRVAPLISKRGTCTFKVFQVTCGAKVVRKGGAADVVGQMCLEFIFFGDAGVDVAASSYVQRSQ